MTRNECIKKLVDLVILCAKAWPILAEDLALEGTDEEQQIAVESFLLKHYSRWTDEELIQEYRKNKVPWDE